MTRLIDPGLAETQEPIISAAATCLDFSLGATHYLLTSHGGSVTIGATTYQPAAFTSGAIEERDDGSISSVQLSFSLADAQMIAETKSRADYMWHQIFIVNAIQLAAPTSWITLTTWPAYISARQYAQGHESGAITLTVQDARALLSRPGNVRSDSTSQKARAPGDTFFDNAPGLQGQHIVWFGARGGPGGGPGRFHSGRGPGHRPEQQ